MALLGLPLLSENLEDVGDFYNSHGQWRCIQKEYERYTVLNGLAARQNVYIATIMVNEKKHCFIKRLRQVFSLEVMDGNGFDKELSGAVMNTMPQTFEHLIVAMHVNGSDERIFPFGCI